MRLCATTRFDPLTGFDTADKPPHGSRAQRPPDSDRMAARSAA